MATRGQVIKDQLGKRSVVFVGMMGSGKTAIGRLVANALKVPFYDSDQEIVAAANMDIPEIFESHGETYFRNGEEKVIQRLLSEGPCVISLGGGAFMSAVTRAAIEKSGISVWLTAELDLLFARVNRRPGTRPLLKVPDPKAKLRDLMAEREPIYALASLHVPSSKVSKNSTRDAVLSALEAHLASEKEAAGDD